MDAEPVQQGIGEQILEVSEQRQIQRAATITNNFKIARGTVSTVTTYHSAQDEL